jgi:hypothetical protein
VLPDGVEPTIKTTDVALRTYVDVNLHGIFPAAYPDRPLDIFTRNPWRAPGRAPVASPCGVGGGNPTGCTGGGCDGGGYAGGPDARRVRFEDPVTTKWKSNSSAEVSNPVTQVAKQVTRPPQVAFGISANHGGGYAYRLCPSDDAALNESCFQRHHLDFVGDTQWFQLGPSRSSRSVVGPWPAVRLSRGTHPAGSQWTRNPIPACAPPPSRPMHSSPSSSLLKFVGGDGAVGRYLAPGRGPGFGNLTIDPAQRGGSNQSAFPNTGGAIPCSHRSYVGGFWENQTNQQGPQFEPPGGWPGLAQRYPGLYLYGFGNAHSQNDRGRKSGNFMFSIVDLVHVPAALPPGNYVLSFRYDAEQTAQVRSVAPLVAPASYGSRHQRASSRLCDIMTILLPPTSRANCKGSLGLHQCCMLPRRDHRPAPPALPHGPTCRFGTRAPTLRSSLQTAVTQRRVVSYPTAAQMRPQAVPTQLLVATLPPCHCLSMSSTRPDL